METIIDIFWYSLFGFMGFAFTWFVIDESIRTIIGE